MNAELLVLMITTSSISAENKKRIYVREGGAVNLTCIVNSTQEVTWLVPPKLSLYVVGKQTHTEKYPNLKLQQSENLDKNILQIQNFSRTNEGSYRCQTKQKDFDYEILINDISHVTVEVHPFNVIEGYQITLTCKHDSTDPQAKISWKPECHSKTVGNSSTCFIDHVSRRNTAVYTCEVASGSDLVRNNTALIIQYAPEISIRYTVLNYLEVELECVPNGVPDAYVFSPWEHKGYFGTHIGYLSNTSKIRVPMHSSIFSGYFVCNVTNGIPDTDGKLWIQQAYHLNFSENTLWAENFKALSTEDAIHVSWRCNFDSEYPQLFLVEFLRENEYIWHKQEPMVNATFQEQCDVSLVGLKANTRYCIRLRFVNRTVYTNATCIFTKENGISEAVLICFIGTAVLVFISVTVCYWACTYKDRKSNSSGQNCIGEGPSTQLTNASTINHQLKYIQVWFKPVPKTRKMCVHGNENRKQYANIDLTLKAEPLPESESEECD